MLYDGDEKRMAMCALESLTVPGLYIHRGIVAMNLKMLPPNWPQIDLQNDILFIQRLHHV